MNEQMAHYKVSSAKTTDLADGDSSLAWSNLVNKYQPKTTQNMVALKQELHNMTLTDWTEDPDGWIDKLTRKQIELHNMSYTVTDNDLIIHILNNLPKEYENLVENEMKDMTTITLNGLRKRINAKYK